MLRDTVQTNRLRLKLERPPLSASPLFTAAHSDPRSIDELLIPKLLDASLPSALAYLIQGAVTGNVTPPLYWGGDPRVPRTDMLNCMVHATMIGRAFSLLSTSAPAPAGKTDDDVVSAASLLPTELKLKIYAEYQLYQQQRRRIWQHGLTPVFIKAIMSGPDPAPAARFAAAILFLTCWTSIKAARPPVKGTGTEYVWYYGTFSDEEWSLDDLEGALNETKQLPRENWDYQALQAKINDKGKEFQGVPEYVPFEYVEMLDAARKHVAEGGTEWPQRDYTSGEVVTIALEALEHAQQATGNGAKGNWNDYLGHALNEWKKETSGQWMPSKPKPRPVKKKGKNK
ncbi:hypothetical protein DFH09DRAFT_1127384 [Mycena vulgaris]|nr:hypothetical protein DFH09DRAFT_1127384 [Mycena vulgaris]